MITIKNLVKTYVNGPISTPVLKGIDLNVERGEFVALVGRSGAGKSTLMYQMGLLDTPTSGEIILDGVDTRTLSLDDRTTFRLERLGYVFQDYALMPELNAIENVMVPLLMQGKPTALARNIARSALDKVGLEGKYNNLPSQLSGGQQQRVSIARAVAHEPTILFADEPTANLDNESSLRVIEIFKELNEKTGQTIVMVTHEEDYSKLTQRIVTLSDGKVIGDERLKKTQ